MQDVGNALPNNAPKERKSATDWARFWFAQLARFHRVHDPAQWSFTELHVVAFLRAKVAAGMPAWKRLLIVKALIHFRNNFMRAKAPRLEHLPASARP